jgi:diaminohydroxyphosphoribosylaminopyrimidine deaminase/5-amino-6-(5-phosphoribosylamino)uracil reductase
MERCLELAAHGIGTARPNPSVGAVVVCDHKIIGEGYTSPYGGAHAEVNAINAVKDKSQLSKATLYVTLEPCAHFGKTPPCADLIVKCQIPTVVIGCVDTNSLVAGKGIEKLKKAGCEVIVGVLEKECLYHHRRFFTVQNKKRPYIVLKWAETKDGFIAPQKRNIHAPVWITNQTSRQLVHKWRAQEQAILVGTQTVIADNPKLTIRTWSGENPIRVIIDRNLKLSKEFNVLDQSVLTIIITAQEKENVENLMFEKINFSANVPLQICEILHVYKIQSVLIEGGAQTLQSFIDAGLWDEAAVFIGNTTFKEGVAAPKISGKLVEESFIQEDVLKRYRND